MRVNRPDRTVRVHDAIRFTTLDALCREFDCQRGDILTYDEGPDDNG